MSKFKEGDKVKVISHTYGKVYNSWVGITGVVIGTSIGGGWKVYTRIREELTHHNSFREVLCSVHYISRCSKESCLSPYCSGTVSSGLRTGQPYNQ